MSALRIATPHEPVRYIDLGPSERPARPRGLPSGRLCVPETTTRWRDQDVRAADRVKAFRKRHGVNGKQRVAS